MSFWSRISSSVGASPARKAGEPAVVVEGGGVALAEEPSPEAAEASRQAKERLDHLFRWGTRQGAINPLHYVMTRYRAQAPK